VSAEGNQVPGSARLAEAGNAAAPTSRLPRTNCFACSHSVPIRRNGTLREHHQVGSLLDNTQICPASGHDARCPLCEASLNRDGSCSMSCAGVGDG
jgi:hypothetical protein